MRQLRRINFKNIYTQFYNSFFFFIISNWSLWCFPETHTSQSHNNRRKRLKKIPRRWLRVCNLISHLKNSKTFLAFCVKSFFLLFSFFVYFSFVWLCVRVPTEFQQPIKVIFFVNKILFIEWKVEVERYHI